MKRLIQHGLMFGNLFHVASPALVERYNRALKHLTGKTTALTDFHVDISGFSPEIGDEMGDDHYLNHAGVNRQFILLSTEQKRCPLLHVKFSTSRDILRRFIEVNERQLFALTATDAVAGELVNSVFEVSSPAKLFDIRQVRIEADTTRGTLRHADHLAELVERFKTGEDAWFDDALIGEMIATAEQTGDVTRNPVHLEHEVFEQSNFWTAHFGGLYVFQGVEHPAVIASGAKPEGVPLKHGIELGTGQPGFIPGNAGLVGQRQHLHPQRAVAPVGGAERVLVPVVPEGVAGQHGAFDLETRIPHLRRQRIRGVAAPVVVDGD